MRIKVKVWKKKIRSLIQSGIARLLRLKRSNKIDPAHSENFRNPLTCLRITQIERFEKENSSIHQEIVSNSK